MSKLKNTCKRKVQYRTVEEALAVATKHHHNDLTIQVYLCDRCKYFHIGHRSKDSYKHWSINVWN